MEWFRRLFGRLRRQRHRLQVWREALRPRGSEARAFVRAGISRRMRVVTRRRNNYLRWIELFDQLTSEDRQEIGRAIESNKLPTINVVWVLHATARPQDVEHSISSLQRQLLRKWTLTILVPAGFDMAATEELCRPETRTQIEAVRAWTDVRLPEENLLLVLAPGLLREHALYAFAQAAANGAGAAYCDSDFIDGQGVRSSPAFRPSFSPELARQTNYFGPCLYLKASGILSGLDLTDELKVSRAIAAWRTSTVARVPLILFHQTGHREARIEASDETCVPTSVSIIIPTRDRVELLRPCIESIRSRTDYPSDKIEIIVIDNGSADPDTLEYLRTLASLPGTQVIRDDGPFNYSSLNNQAARRAGGEILVLLNNDIVIEGRHWLARLVSYAMKPDVAAVGGKLVYPDRTVQHGGVILGIGGGALHANLYLPEHAMGYLHLNTLDHEVAAVTGACLAIRKSTFEALGGLDENLAVSFNDVTLCAKAIHMGFRNVSVGSTLAIHFESKSRGFDDTPEKAALARKEASFAVSRYRSLFREDPFYSPNLNCDHPYALAFPPRLISPWRVDKTANRKLRVLLLAWPGLGEDVPALIQAHADNLAARGHHAIIAGPRSRLRITPVDAEQATLGGPDAAAEFAIRNRIDCVVIYTAPFYSVVRWLGNAVKSLAFDWGTALAEPDAIADHKQFWLAWSDQVVAARDAKARNADRVSDAIEALCAN